MRRGGWWLSVSSTGAPCIHRVAPGIVLVVVLHVTVSVKSIAVVFLVGLGSRMLFRASQDCRMEVIAVHGYGLDLGD